jgi:hypothetical protein
MSNWHRELCSVQNGMGSLDKTTASPVLAKTYNGIQTVKLSELFEPTSYKCILKCTYLKKKTENHTEIKCVQLKRVNQKVFWHRISAQ